jgi:hypothetical protein
VSCLVLLGRLDFRGFGSGFWPWHVAVQGCWRASGTSYDEIDANDVQGGRADHLCAGKAWEERQSYREPNTERVESEWSDASDEEGISARGGGVNIIIFENHSACKLYQLLRGIAECMRATFVLLHLVLVLNASISPKLGGCPGVAVRQKPCQYIYKKARFNAISKCSCKVVSWLRHSKNKKAKTSLSCTESLEDPKPISFHD